MCGGRWIYFSASFNLLKITLKGTHEESTGGSDGNFFFSHFRVLSWKLCCSEAFDEFSEKDEALKVLDNPLVLAISEFPISYLLTVSLGYAHVYIVDRLKSSYVSDL